MYTLSKSQDFAKKKHANGIKVGTFDHHKVDKEIHTVTQNCVFSVWLPGESLMNHTYISRPSQTIMLFSSSSHLISLWHLWGLYGSLGKSAGSLRGVCGACAASLVREFHFQALL